MDVKVMPLYNFEGPMEIGKWYDSLIYCPSQCYRHEERGGLHYILYLHWRHDDPWHGKIICGASDEHSLKYGQWTDDMFVLHNLQYKYDDIERAKEALVNLFENVYLKGGRK